MGHDFLLCTFEGGGNVAILARAVEKLRARRHRVRVLCDEVSRAEYEAAGAEFRPWREAPNRRDRRPESDPLYDPATPDSDGGLPRALDNLVFGPAAAYAADTLAELRRAPADAVLATDVLLGPGIGARAAGAPLVNLSTNLSMFTPVPGLPPAGPGFLPATNDEERQRDAEVLAWYAGELDKRLPVLNAARSRFGLVPLTRALDQAYDFDLHVLMTSEAFDYPNPKKPGYMRYVGPDLAPPVWGGDWKSPWAPDDRRPLALIALSTTFMGQKPQIQALLDAVAGLDVRALVTLGPAMAGASFRAPPNAVIVDAAPHDAVMGEASVVATHCGHGTVMRALAHGLPMLCLPMGRDQNDNAARVAARGAGLRLDPDASVEAFRDALARLVAEPSFAENARKLGSAIAAAERPDALAETLEAFVAERQPMRARA
jgi:UDP:flavonoid glycosyltransferase YjiC (YdhE family)